MNQSEMQSLTARTESLVNAISGAILGTVEVAAERLSLAAEVARVAQRLEAFSAVLEAIAAQKDALAARLAGARGAMRGLVQRQIELLTLQEVAILQRAGAPAEAAQLAVAAADEPLYRRVGSRFEALVAGNGAAGTNWAAGGNGHGGAA